MDTIRRCLLAAVVAACGCATTQNARLTDRAEPSADDQRLSLAARSAEEKTLRGEDADSSERATPNQSANRGADTSANQSEDQRRVVPVSLEQELEIVPLTVQLVEAAQQTSELPEAAPAGDPSDSTTVDQAASGTTAFDAAVASAPFDNMQLTDVINSVHRAFPLVQAAFQERQIANGNQLASWGEFDTKFKASSESGPLGFYETYRNSLGITKPLYGGGQVFGGYRNGGGDFQPWYEERETNDGGEFKAGVRVPLIRDRDIDARRAAVWRATYDRQIADPVIRAMLIEFSREASFAYWKWVAAGQKVRIGVRWLKLAQDRDDRIARRVEVGDLDNPVLVDNRRAIAKRESKLADSRQQLQQAAVKLSLYLRDENGLPLVPSESSVPEFPLLRDPAPEMLNAEILRARQNRPQLLALDLQWQQLRVDYAEACNLTRPGLDAQLIGSQDVGQPTSKKRDKSEFELEAGLFFDVPLERRKGRGKMVAVQAKMNQVAAKRRMVADKVTAEVQSALAGLLQSQQAALRAREAVALADEMARIERVKFNVGQSDLLKVALREQYALEAAEDAVTATHMHFKALAEFAAAIAVERPYTDLLPALPEQAPIELPQGQADAGGAENGQAPPVAPPVAPEQ